MSAECTPVTCQTDFVVCCKPACRHICTATHGFVQPCMKCARHSVASAWAWSGGLPAGVRELVGCTSLLGMGPPFPRNRMQAPCQAILEDNNSELGLPCMPLGSCNPSMGVGGHVRAVCPCSSPTPRSGQTASLQETRLFHGIELTYNQSNYARLLLVWRKDGLPLPAPPALASKLSRQCLPNPPCSYFMRGGCGQGPPAGASRGAWAQQLCAQQRSPFMA